MERSQGIAQSILHGFDRHYRRFREISARAAEHFRVADWEAARQDNRDRILMYEQRVQETVEYIQARFPEASADYEIWPQIKRAYIGLLLDHLQVECAETFYNSVACRLLHRRYYRNDYIFWRPTLNTEHLEGSQETYRCYYPAVDGQRRALLRILADAGLANRFDNLRRDVRFLEQALLDHQPARWKMFPNYQLQVLGSLFYRNKAAYIVGRQINGDRVEPLIIPLLQNDRGEICADALLTRSKDASLLFSFTRMYFMADMEVPSAFVSFLTSIMPTKSKVDLYAILGLQKHAKTLFYREMQHHLKHSSDNFQVAPGIPGTVMLVFTLPSFPFVVKIIKDRFDPPKVTNREHVKDCYTLVKFHDRVGRLADTLEYSLVAIPLDRIDGRLLAELRRQVGGSIEIDGDMLVIRHCYIERRMIPLNEFLATAPRKQLRRVIHDYGCAIKDLAGANIFPGDMMQKNFGVTRLSRVVFYDYDEIQYMTDCNFRVIPDTGDYFDDLCDEPSYSIQENDVFPETFGSFFFPNPELRKVFMEMHPDLVTTRYWKRTRQLILAGGQSDVFPYSPKARFCNRYAGQGRLLRRDAA
jgi:isocitrate dehydrogenase kinase/phosphatase